MSIIQAPYKASLGSLWVLQVIECTSCKGSGKTNDLQTVWDGKPCRRCRGYGRETELVGFKDAIISQIKLIFDEILRHSKNNGTNTSKR